jgi:hypothetical protein
VRRPARPLSVRKVADATFSAWAIGGGGVGPVIGGALAEHGKWYVRCFCQAPILLDPCYGTVTLGDGCFVCITLLGSAIRCGEQPIQISISRYVRLMQPWSCSSLISRRLLQL